MVTLRLTLHPGRDDDLISIVQQAQKGQLAAVIRETMRSGIVRKQQAPEENDGFKIEVDVWDL